MHVMSADTQKTPRKRTAEEVYRHIEEWDMDHEPALRTLRNQLPWKDWLVVDFLRYWYGIGVIALVVFMVLGLAMQYNVSDLIGVLELFVLAVAMAILGFLGYMILWPEGGLTRGDRIGRGAQRLVRRKRRRRFE